MAQVQIKVPNSLDLASALKLSIVLSQLEESEEFIFDFSNTMKTEPFPMLMVSSEIRRLRTKYPGSKMACVNYKHMTYAGHMGFFRAFGLDFGKAPGEASGSSRYLPLTIFNVATIKRKAAEQSIEVGDQVERESKRLAAILCGGDSGSLFDTLSYSVREMMRNVVEHSNSSRFGICAQYWPSKKRVEVAILDRGMGLKESLKHNPHLDVSDDKAAINYALMPAVSGKTFKGSKSKQKGPWANSGFGLYMTNRICRNGGNFFIASGSYGMLLTKFGEGKSYSDCQFKGTAIRMVLRTDQIADLKDSLETYRNEGYLIQQKYREIVKIDPSSASLMLSEDFNLSVWDKLLAKLRLK